MARRRGRSVSDVTRNAGSRPPTSSFNQPEDDTVTSGAVFGMVAFTAFLALVVAAVYFGTSNIESDIEARANRALQAAGFTEVAADASGTEVQLSGTYTINEVDPSASQDPEQAFSAVSALAGVGDVTGQIWPTKIESDEAILVRGAPIEASWEFGRVTLSGNVSTPEKLQLIETTLAGTFRSVDVDGITVKEGLADETAWLGPMLFLLQSVAVDLDTGLMRVDGPNGYVVVQGEVLDKELRDDLNEAVTEAASGVGFDATPGVVLLQVGPTEEEVEELQENLNDLVLDQVVEFEVKSFDLTAAGRALLDEVAAALEGAPEVRVLVEGHTDDRGSESENQTLSERRAEAVVAYLVSKGLAAERFDTIGYGESQPIESNNTADGRARNRRIEFTALLDGVQGEEEG